MEFLARVTAHIPNKHQALTRYYGYYANRVRGGRGAEPYYVMDSVVARQTERIRAMTADEKVRLSHALWLEARDVLIAGVRARHPDWTDASVAARVRELMRDAGT